MGFGVVRTLTHPDHWRFRTSLHSASDVSRSRRSTHGGLSWLTDWRRFRLRSLLASTCSVLAETLSLLPGVPDPLRVTGFGFTLTRITSHSSRTRFAGRLNSGVGPLGSASLAVWVSAAATFRRKPRAPDFRAAPSLPFGSWGQAAGWRTCAPQRFSRPCSGQACRRAGLAYSSGKQAVGFIAGGPTIHSSRRHFVARLNSGVRPQWVKVRCGSCLGKSTCCLPVGSGYRSSLSSVSASSRLRSWRHGCHARFALGFGYSARPASSGKPRPYGCGIICFRYVVQNRQRRPG